MKRSYIILIFLLIWSYSQISNAQNIKAEYSVQAKQSLKYPTYTEPFILFVDIHRNKSLFISKNKLISGRIMKKYFRKQKSKGRRIGVNFSDPEMQNAKKYKNKFKVVVEKNSQTHQYKYQQHAFMSALYYQAKLPIFKWLLENAEKNIKGYLVRKATLEYKGRHYTAWYAPDIAVSDGPYKFWGLPGLIFEIYDDNNDYHFTLTGLEFSDNIQFPEHYFLKGSTLMPVIQTTEKNFQKDFDKTFNPDNVLGNTAYIGKNSEEMKAARVQKFKSKYNNPIELMDE